MKKQVIKTFIVTVVFALTVSNVALLAQFGGGNGTQANPYEIHNKTHFNLLTDSVNNSIDFFPNWSRGKYFKLMNDITDTVRTVIGRFRSNSFEGHFDGNGFKIVLGIDINNLPVDGGVGLFGKIDVNATISNVTVEGYVKGQNRVGGIVGNSRRSVTVDGIITIKNCINNCDITGLTSLRSI